MKMMILLFEEDVAVVFCRRRRRHRSPSSAPPSFLHLALLLAAEFLGRVLPDGSSSPREKHRERKNLFVFCNDFEEEEEEKRKKRKQIRMYMVRPYDDTRKSSAGRTRGREYRTTRRVEIAKVGENRPKKDDCISSARGVFIRAL